MTENEFWSVIDEARLKAGDMEAIPAWLEDRLVEQSPAEIYDFGAWLAHFMKRAHDARLWNAGAIINGGLSDDGFVYFKCWLISRGQAVYEAALLDPDSLADLDYPDYQPERGWLGRPNIELEELMYVHRIAGNKKCSKDKHAAVKRPDGWEPPAGCQPDGKVPKVRHHEDLVDTNDAQALSARFPRLARRFTAGS